MASKTPAAKQTLAAPVTAERAARLYKLLKLLGRKPQARDVLAEALKLPIRGFYRDLEALREAKIEVKLVEGRYYLADKLADVVARLPFPDPGLTLGEAMQLARGRGKAHRKLKQQVGQITK